MTETVTIPRAEYEALLERIRDLEDTAVLAERRGDPTIAFETTERLLAGENPVVVWREERGLSRQALATAAGVSPSMLIEIEHGRQVPPLAVARALATALRVGLDDLFGRAGLTVARTSLG